MVGRHNMKGKDGIEQVMLILTIAVSAMLILATLGIFIFKFLHPTDAIDISGGFYDIMKLVLSAIIGYVAGRGLKAEKKASKESAND
jgi:hypothetical protein